MSLYKEIRPDNTELIVKSDRKWTKSLITGKMLQTGQVMRRRNVEVVKGREAEQY